MAIFKLSILVTCSVTWTKFIWYTWIYIPYLPVCHSGQYISVMALLDFLFASEDLIEMKNSYLRGIFKFIFTRVFEGLLSCWLPNFNTISLFQWKLAVFIEMAQHTMVTKTHGAKRQVSIRYYNLHSFKEGALLLCQSILGTGRMSNWCRWALFTVPLSTFI